MDGDTFTAHVVELTAVNPEENETIIEFTEDGVIVLSSLCRICANQCGEHFIPIYEGEGLEHELELKMNKYLSFNVERDSSLPVQCCIQCASTLLAWHEFYETSIVANRKLKTLQGSTVQQVIDENDKFDNGETTTEEQMVETLSETADISFPEDSAERPDQYRPNNSESFHQAEISSETVTLNINDKSSQTCSQLNTIEISNDEIKLESVSTENSQTSSGTSPRKTNYKKRKSKHSAKPTESDSNQFKTEETWIKTETEEIPLNEITEEHSYVSNACWLEKKESAQSNASNDVDKGFSEPCQEYSPNNKKGKTKRKEPKNKTCNICDKIFKRVIDLRKHSKTHEANDELIISEPDVKEEAEDNVDYFKMEDDDSEMECENGDAENGDGAVKGRSYHCLFCAEIFTSRIELHDHKLSNHFEKIREKKRSRLDQEAVNKAKIVVDSRTYYHCTECGKNLHSPYTYIWHNRIHTGERPFVCDLCGKQFRVSQGLVRHLRETHAGIKNFPCDLCGRMFATRRNVEEHRRIHTNERPYICDLCGKSFKQKASLFVHNRSHTDSFPFVCSYCGQGFRTRPPLLVHVTRHTGEKPYACDVCGRCFRIKYELKRHKLIHSDDKPFSCLDCGLSFRQKRYLRNHNKINHNRTTPYFGKKIPEIDKNNFSESYATNENDAPAVKYIRIKTEPIIKEEPLRTGYDNQSNENVKIIKIDFDENVCKQEIGSEYVNPIYLCQKCETTFDNEEQFVDHLNLHEDSSAGRKNSSVLGSTSAIIDAYNEQDNINYLNADQNANKFSNESKFQIKPYTKSGKKLSEQPSIIKIENYSADFRHEMLDHLSAGLKNGKGNIEIVNVNTEPQNATSSDDMDVTYESTEVENNVLGIIFECEFCLLRFENKSDWLNHEHSYVGDLMCQICGQLYEKQSNLDEHLQQHERAVSLTYENEEEIHLIQDQPMENSYGKTVKDSNQNDRTTFFTCSECSEIFNSKVALTSHRRIHKRNVVYSCELCGKKFKNEYRMKNHCLLHDYYNSRYECHPCNLIFSDKISYKNHLNYHMGKNSMLKILTCEICFKVFTRTSNLNSHLTTHIKDHYCIVCCCSFITQLRLENHMSAHSNEDVAAAKEAPQVVGCSYENCGQMFPSRLQCYEHKKIHLELIEYQCDICSKKYPKFSQLVTHQKSHDGDNVCKICNKMFKNQKSLKEHLVLHTDEKKYQCDVCFIKFRWQSGLASHKSVHTNVRKYTCGVCKRGFARSNYLKEHLRTHRKEKPFDCKVCGRCFVQTSILRNHMGLVHRTCQICKLMIGNRRQIKIHMWKNHPEFAKSTGIKPVKVDTKCLKNE